MASIASSRERVTAGGLVLNGTVDINQNGILSFEGDGGLSGNGKVICSATPGLATGSRSTATAPPPSATGTTVRGHSGTIGKPSTSVARRRW
jgi:hypothetical protein